MIRLNLSGASLASRAVERERYRASIRKITLARTPRTIARALIAHGSHELVSSGARDAVSVTGASAKG